MNHTERTNAIRAARARAEMELEDVQRLEFLISLSGAQIRLSEWEADFVKAQLLRRRLRTPANVVMRFTSPQREKIDEMKKHYGGRL